MMDSKNFKRGRQFSIFSRVVVVGGLVIALPHFLSAALLPSTVFNDNLPANGSTLGAASQSFPNSATPTATSTNYDNASSKNATASVFSAGGPLQLEMASSSSGINEAQAVFTTTPVVLTNIGDAIEITATFKAVAGINSNASSAVYLGLYSSGGKAPYNNLNNGSSAAPPQTGLVNTQVNDNTGGVQNWVGFESDYFGGQATKIFTRPAQATSTNNVDQALVGAGQTGGPGGTQATYVGQNSTETTLTAGNVYTDEMSITLSALNTYTITEALYNGATDTGTQVGTTTTTAGLAALPSGGFDGLAIGYRESASLASELDISQVQVTTTVPEPATLGLLALTGLSLMHRRRRQGWL